MVRTRLELHEKLCGILGSRNVYFSAPSVMKYPCIKYDMQPFIVDYADNIKYRNKQCWSLTVIDTDPDSEILNRLEDAFQYLSFDRFYATDGLNHFVYTLYY